MDSLTLRVFTSEARIPSGSYGRYLRCTRSEAGLWSVDAGNWPRGSIGDRPFEVEVAPGSLIASMTEADITEMPRDWCLRFGFTDPAHYPGWLPLPHESAPDGAWMAVIEKARALQPSGRRALADNADNAYQAYLDAGGGTEGQLKALASLGGAA